MSAGERGSMYLALLHQMASDGKIVDELVEAGARRNAERRPARRPRAGRRLSSRIGLDGDVLCRSGTAAGPHVGSPARHPNTVRYRLRRLHEIAGLPSVAAQAGKRLTVLE